MSNPPGTLAYFFMNHCLYLSDTELLNLETPSQAQREQHLECPICLSSLVSNADRAIQINLPRCQHAFDAQCISRHIIAGYNTCPLCRTKWFDIPVGATTARNAADDAEHRVWHLQELLRAIYVLIQQCPLVESEEEDESEVDTEDEENDENIMEPTPSAETDSGSLETGPAAARLRHFGQGDRTEWRRQQARRREESRALNARENNEDRNVSE